MCILLNTIVAIRNQNPSYGISGPVSTCSRGHRCSYLLSRDSSSSTASGHVFFSVSHANMCVFVSNDVFTGLGDIYVHICGYSCYTSVDMYVCVFAGSI